MKEPEFETGHGNRGALMCPYCGMSNLHHSEIEIFEREQEDSENGLYLYVTGTEVRKNNSMRENPSSRRDALQVRFWCEGCAAEPTLRIVQHKGTTWVDFGDIDVEETAANHGDSTRGAILDILESRSRRKLNKEMMLPMQLSKEDKCNTR